jgi:hypothetical protein
VLAITLVAYSALPLGAQDFTPKRLQIALPPPDSWADLSTAALAVAAKDRKKTALAIGAMAISSWTVWLAPRLFHADFQTEMKKLEAAKQSKGAILIGTAICPGTLVAGSPEGTIGRFQRRHLSVRYAIESEFAGIERLRKNLRSFRIVLQAESDKKNSIEIKDVLPNTTFVNANYGGDVSATAKIGISAKGTFEEAAGNAEGTFRWHWQPKNLEIESSAVGNYASVGFHPKTDRTFYVGQIPIELSILTPTDLDHAQLKILNLVESSGGQVLPVGEIVCEVILP